MSHYHVCIGWFGSVPSMHVCGLLPLLGVHTPCAHVCDVLLWFGIEEVRQ
jgi:hypothetical protein